MWIRVLAHTRLTGVAKLPETICLLFSLKPRHTVRTRNIQWVQSAFYLLALFTMREGLETVCGAEVLVSTAPPAERE